MKKLTTEKFIEKAKTKHGDSYDYSKVIYVDSNTKVIIICKIHGEFTQISGKHLSGQGCPECGGTKQLTIEKFIEKAKTKHGDRYDYSKVIYVNGNTEVIIICKIHGEFKQTPASHLSGQGCPECGGSKQSTTEKFIEKIKVKHGDSYDYSKVIYVNNKTKIIIICKIHGVFKQTPGNHLSGKGCSECSGNKQLTTEKFIEKAKTKHGDSYDYSEVIYVNSRTEVIIICKIHGGFKQTPDTHLSGCGCPKCGGKKVLTTEKAKTKHGKV